MSQRGTYDVAIENINLVDVHQSNSDREFNIKVIDNTQETRIDTETENKKSLFKQHPKHTSNGNGYYE